MVDESNHHACVRAWFERAASATSREQTLHAFEQGFGALWTRAQLTLGDVTLTAIVDRVLYNAAERFPMFSSVTVAGSGPRFQELEKHAATMEQDDVEEGIRFVLVEFLTVLGNLTAEVLTPALHAELSKVAQEETASRARDAGSPTRTSKDDEEAES